MRTDITQGFVEGEKGQARDKAAADTGTNPRYISDAKRLKATGLWYQKYD
jgi:hypothetical protein